MRNPLPSGINNCLIAPRGGGGAVGRGSFHAKVLVLFIKNVSLACHIKTQQMNGKIYFSGRRVISVKCMQSVKT